VKIVFQAYLRETWIDLRQTKTKMITSPIYTYRRVHFTSINVSFLLGPYIFQYVCLTYLTYLSFPQYWNALDSSYCIRRLPLH